MNLATVENKIRVNIDKNKGFLSLIGVDEPIVNNIAEIMDVAPVITNPEIAIDDKSLNITGKVDLPNISGIQAKLAYECGEGTDVETCRLWFTTPSEDKGNLATDLRIAPLQYLIDEFSPPSIRVADLTISFDPQANEFTIDLKPGLMIPYFDLSLSEVRIKIIQKMNEFDQKIYSVSMEGNLTIGEEKITLEYRTPKVPSEYELRGSVSLSDNLSTFVGNCLGTLNTPMLPSMSQLETLEITDVSLKIAPHVPQFSAIVTTSLGDVEFVVMLHPEDKTLMGIIAFPLEINTVLEMLSESRLPEWISSAISNTVVVISNVSMEKKLFKATPPLESVELSIDLAKGITLQASFEDDLITTLLNADSLDIAGSIGLKPLTFEFLAESTMDVIVCDFLSLKGFLFKIWHKEKTEGVQAGTTVEVRIGEEQILLAGDIKLEMKDELKLTLQAYMKEEWIEPFGLKGFTLHDLGVTLGIEYPLELEFGFLGDVTLGTFRGGAAVLLSEALYIKTGLPFKMLNFEFNELNIGALIRFLLPEDVENISEPFLVFLDDIALKDVKFYFALDKVTIGDVSFKKGLHMKGTVYLFNNRIHAEALVDKDSGIYFCAEIGPIDISPDGFEILKLTHATDPSQGALVELDLQKTSYNPHLIVSGAISVFGDFMKGLVDINISEHGFYFLASCSIVDLFEASLDVKGPSLERFLNGSFEGVHLKAYMKNDLLETIRKTILNFIQEVTDSAVTELNDAQKALIAAQQELKNLDDQIDEMKEQLQPTYAAAVAELEAARTALTDAQNGLNQIDVQINSLNSRIRTLNNEIAWWNNWYASLGFWARIANSARIVYEVGWREAEKTGHYASIGVLTLERTIAWAILEAAKTGLRIAEAFVVASDPSVDPALAALILSREAAWAALKLAEGIVIGIRLVVSGFSSLVQFVVDWSLGKAFDIKSATFEANFNDMKDRIVEFEADILFIGISSHIEFSLNFDDYLASIKNLALKIFENAGIALPP